MTIHVGLIDICTYYRGAATAHRARRRAAQATRRGRGHADYVLVTTLGEHVQVKNRMQMPIQSLYRLGPQHKKNQRGRQRGFR
jgi:hypothetical protein